MRYDPYILSSFSVRDPTSKNGKMKWLAKNTDFKKSNILNHEFREIIPNN